MYEINLPPPKVPEDAPWYQAMVAAVNTLLDQKVLVSVEPDYEAHRFEIETLVDDVLYAMKYGNQEERARAGEVSIEAASGIAAALGIGGSDDTQG